MNGDWTDGILSEDEWLEIAAKYAAMLAEVNVDEPDVESAPEADDDDETGQLGIIEAEGRMAEGHAVVALRFSAESFNHYVTAAVHADDHDCAWGIALILDLMEVILDAAGDEFFGEATDE